MARCLGGARLPLLLDEMVALRHEQLMNAFITFLGWRANLNIATVTAKDISDFRESREGQGLSNTTVNLDVTVLSAAFARVPTQSVNTVEIELGAESRGTAATGSPLLVDLLRRASVRDSTAKIGG